MMLTLTSSQIVQLREELQSTATERYKLLSRKTEDTVEDASLEMIRSSLSSVSEERDQLVEILQALREEKNQMCNELKEKNHKVILILPVSNRCKLRGQETSRLQLCVKCSGM